MKKVSSKWSMLFILLCFLGAGSATADEAKFPRAKAGFQPKKNYEATFERMWTIVKQTLENEKIDILTADKNEGKIVTDYIQGESKALYSGAMIVSLKYSYTISIEKIGNDKTRLGIICKLEKVTERKRGGNEWRDITKERPVLVDNLERWLYERIESNL